VVAGGVGGEGGEEVIEVGLVGAVGGEIGWCLAIMVRGKLQQLQFGFG
jgi:hypothetical protein